MQFIIKLAISVIHLLFLTTFVYGADIDSKSLNLLLNKAHEQGLFNGNVLIARKGEILYQKEFGYTDGGQSTILKANSVFSLGSITKEFNAVSIMLLNERGMLKLSDKLDSFDLDLPAWSTRVSVADLLNYSSGLPKVNFATFAGPNDDLQQLRAIKTLAFEPGKGYLYSNHNVFLQLRIIEKLTGLSYAEFLKQNILLPIGIKNALFDADPSKTDAVYSFNNNKRNDQYRRFPIDAMISLNIHETFVWLTQLHEANIISTNAINYLFNSQMENGQSPLGEGLFENNKLKIHQHHGSHFNFESLIHFDKENSLSIVLLSNNKNGKLQQVLADIKNIVVLEKQ